ncbi:hypothetical protein L9F63_019247, partial [Diploptera punctata]
TKSYMRGKGRTRPLLPIRKWLLWEFVCLLTTCIKRPLPLNIHIGNTVVKTNDLFYKRNNPPCCQCSSSPLPLLTSDQETPTTLVRAYAFRLFYDTANCQHVLLTFKGILSQKPTYISDQIRVRKWTIIYAVIYAESVENLLEISNLCSNLRSAGGRTYHHIITSLFHGGQFDINRYTVYESSYYPSDPNIKQ